MRTKEHMVVVLPGHPTEASALLDEMSEEGWELITVDDGVGYFRRPVVIGRVQ